MKKANKKKLAEASALLEQARDIIVSVKQEYYDGRDRNDEYYALEDIEVKINEAEESLTTYTD